jgi:hypothetical protein
MHTSALADQNGLIKHFCRSRIALARPHAEDRRIDNETDVFDGVFNNGEGDDDDPSSALCAEI